MENLIHEIDGKKYVLIDIRMVEGNQMWCIEPYHGIIEKYEMHYQGIKKIHRGGLLSSSYIIYNYLIPEDKYFEFAKEMTYELTRYHENSYQEY